MSHLRIIDDQVVYPYFGWDGDFPLTSFPYPREGVNFPDQGIFWVQPSPAPGLPPEGKTYIEDVPKKEDGKWVQTWKEVDLPPPVTPTQQYNRYYGNAKLDLFTTAEQLAVVEAGQTDAYVKLMYDRLLGAAYLTYESEETKQGLDLLVSKGLLTPERREEIATVMTTVPTVSYD